jgi:hypothetical protein
MPAREIGTYTIYLCQNGKRFKTLANVAENIPRPTIGETIGDATGKWNFLWFDENGKRRSRKLGDLCELSREQALKKAEAVRQELRFEPQTSATKVN